MVDLILLGLSVQHGETGREGKEAANGSSSILILLASFSFLFPSF